jgi:YfiH family protein
MSFRYGDAAEVAANRAAFLQAGGVDDARIVVMEVAHGDNVVRVGETEAGSARESERVIRAEALMTDELGVGLFLLTADCLPVTFHDSMHGAAALAHIGWKPSVLGLAGKVVREMRAAFGSAPADLSVIIGPCIKKESYAFDDEAAARKRAAASFVSQDATGKWHVDLVGATVAQLAEACVLPERITIDSTDTATSSRYFSHTRAVRTGEPEARFATVAMLE